MKYKWYVNNLNESNIIKDANESVLKLNSSDNIAAIEAIYCIVHNSIKYSNDKHEKESITVFYLNHLETDGTTNMNPTSSDSTTQKPSTTTTTPNFANTPLIINTPLLAVSFMFAYLFIFY
jgi:hypothetical protein